MKKKKQFGNTLHNNLKIKKTLLSAINMHECQCQLNLLL